MLSWKNPKLLTILQNRPSIS
ncbi:hypothetical protein F383_34374 [Gossypium arboreum]|uniref:Uncharacterized protein n=1 Tax=Gossypium arboreum TaxID=29729 RepID=A0A0B0N3H2_GOSAR|nr:hypothetical protein F383_34374 [Gossypium arboreum]